MPSSPELLSGWGGNVGLNVTALRALPIVVTFYASEQPRAAQKNALLLGYAGVVFLAVRFAGFEVPRTLVVYAYLMLASALTYWIGNRGPRLVRLAVSLLVFVAGPALTFPRLWLLPVLGTDLALSTYSFCEDAKEARFNPLRYAFFVFVNPAITYPRRGRRVANPGIDVAGARRAALGVLTLILSGAISSVGSELAPQFGNIGSACSMTARVVSLYCAHVGLASLQIGLMRQLGYVLPERYDRVLLARNPLEFWARWNTYFGSWARLYVFIPIVRWLKGSRISRSQGYACGVVGAFSFMGLLHDVYMSSKTQQLDLSTTTWFLANAVVIIVWHWSGERLSDASMTRYSRWKLARGPALVGILLFLLMRMP